MPPVATTGITPWNERTRPNFVPAVGSWTTVYMAPFRNGMSCWLRGTVATPTAALVDAAGALSDPAGSLLTVSGSTTFAGGTDAVLVRLAP